MRRITKYTVLTAVLGALLWGLVHYKESTVEFTRSELSESAEDSARVVIVTIAADDSISIAGQAIEPQDLEGHFHEIAEADGIPPTIVLQVDDSASTDTMIQVMEAAKRVETESVSISASDT